MKNVLFGMLVALAAVANAFDRPFTYMAVDEAGGASAKNYVPDVVGLLTPSGVVTSAEAKALTASGYARADASAATGADDARILLFRASRLREIASGGTTFATVGEGYVWSVLEEKSGARRVLAFCARLSEERLAALQAEMTAVAGRYGAALVGGGWFGPFGDSPAVRKLMSGGWLDAQQAEPTAEAAPTLMRVFFDPRRVASYEFRLGRSPGRTDALDLRPALFAFRVHDLRAWQPPPCAAKGAAAAMLGRIAAGEFDDAEKVREVVYRPEGVGTVIDTIADTRSVLQAFGRRRPDLAVVLKPVATDDADYDRTVNAEIVTFADGGRVRAEGFAKSYPKSYARTGDAGSRGKWWWIDRVRANRDRIAREGGAYDVVMLGDSITHFWHDFDYWTGGRRVWEKMSEEMRLLNLGYGGDNTRNLLWRLRNGELDGYRAKVFQILIGTNNRDAPEVTAGEIGEIVRLVRAKHPESKIVLLSLFPREDKAEFHARNQAVNALIGKYADGKTVFHMDIGRVFLGADGHLKRGISPDNDKLHLVGWGYELWWQAVAPKYRELCK